MAKKKLTDEQTATANTPEEKRQGPPEVPKQDAAAPGAPDPNGWTAPTIAAFDDADALRRKLVAEGVEVGRRDRTRAKEVFNGLDELGVSRGILLAGVYQHALDLIATSKEEDKSVALAVLEKLPKGPTDKQREVAKHERDMEDMDREAQNAPPDPEPPKSDTKLPYILLDRIDMSEGTRTRVKLNDDAIDRYADWYTAYAKGKAPRGELPPPVLFTQDGQVYFIGDGWHRISSLIKVQIKGWPCDVRKGDKWDAIAFAAQTDLDGPVAKTKDDRGRTVDLMLLDPVRKSWTNGEIARHCGVSDVTVGNHRKKLEKAGKVEPAPVRKRKGGKPINTNNIGKGKKGAPPAPPNETKQAGETRPTSGPSTPNPSESTGPAPAPVVEEAASAVSPAPTPPVASTAPASDTPNPSESFAPAPTPPDADPLVPQPPLAPPPPAESLTWTRERLKLGELEPLPQGAVTVQVTAIHDGMVTLVFQS